MLQQVRRLQLVHRLYQLLLALIIAGSTSGTAFALGSSQNPQAGSIGLEGTIKSAPPTKGGSISTPGSGQSTSSATTTISGLCPNGLLVKIFDNNVFVGSAQCVSGSYSIQISLFSGRNDIVARVFDALDQAGPDSNLVTITFNDTQFIEFGSRVTLTSSYGQRGADPGTELDWPITLSGGTGPYALTVDWGDGTAPDLQSVQFAGELTLKHTYKSAGTYKVIIKATDKNGTTAFLQLVAVANGKPAAGSGSGSSTAATGGAANGTTTNSGGGGLSWLPVAVLLPLIGTSFWLGRRHELFALRKQLEKSRAEP